MRLTPEVINFPPYSKDQIKGILSQRVDYAFVKGVWNDEALSLVADKTYQISDLRVGLHILKQSTLNAQDRSSKKVEFEDVNKALEGINEFSANDSEDLSDDSKNVLEVIKENSGLKIGDMYKLYQEKGNARSYKSFQRDMKKLEQGKFIQLSKLTGDGGNTTVIKYIGNEVKRISDY